MGWGGRYVDRDHRRRDRHDERRSESGYRESDERERGSHYCSRDHDRGRIDRRGRHSSRSSSRSRSRERQRDSHTDSRRRRDSPAIAHHSGSRRSRSPQGQDAGHTSSKPSNDSLQAKMAAWKAKKAALDAQKAAPKSSAAKTMFAVDATGPSGLAPAYVPANEDFAAKMAKRQAEAVEREMTHAKRVAEEEDALDAFMDAEVLPEVTAKREEARKRELEQKQALFEQIKAGKKVPGAECLQEEEDEEAEPDLEIEVPKHKVKLIIGAGGERIKAIQRKTRTRIQVKKEAKELERGFGTGSQIRLPGKIAAIVREHNGGEVEMATIMIFGDSQKVQLAKSMLLEAVDNKEQKQKQRQKEYDRKKDEKARNRQIYLMRHACDYEMLEVPVGTPKSELKAAYRKLALKWHPDKHPNNIEEAQAMFQKITKAYECLMSTDEEAAVKAIAAKQ